MEFFVTWLVELSLDFLESTEESHEGFSQNNPSSYCDFHLDFSLIEHKFFSVWRTVRTSCGTYS
jgi:hypothetical protein